MNTLIRMTVLFIFLLVAGSCLAKNGSSANNLNNKLPLNLGILPYLSTHKLIVSYKPIKDYLEKTLHRHVNLVTAPDFKTYIQRSINGDYDIYHTAPHFAAYAELQAGHRRLSRFTRMLDGAVVVKKDGPIQSIADLKGKVLATPDRLAVITMLGEILMRDNGIEPGTDVKIIHLGSHGNAILSIIRGKADAAVISAAVFERQPDHIKSNLRILTKTKKIPHIMFMAKPGLDEKEFQRIKNALLDFTAEGPGKEFFKQIKRKNMSTISDQHMLSLRPFVDLLKTKLQ